MADSKELDVIASEFAVKLGQIIRTTRTEKGLTQSKLAAMINAHQQTISFWETGRFLPEVYSLVKIAQALDLELKISFGGGESCSPETK